jgi:hypothetical protein
MKSLQDASKELVDHLVFTLNRSIDLKRDGVDPMVPFAVVVKGADKTLKAFAGDTPEFADDMFEKTILDEDPDYVVYASDSYLTVEGVKCDAVLLRAYDKNDPDIYLVGQKFKPKTGDQVFELLGNPAFLGTSEHEFAASVPTGISDSNSKPWWKLW